MTSPDAVPQRLSDAEREAAVSALRAHFNAGRLTSEEFAERSDSARAARTASDVTPLFGDLPSPHPHYVEATQPTWNTYPGAASPGGPSAYGTTSYATPEPGSPSYQSFTQATPTYTGTVLPRAGSQLPATTTDRWLGVAHAVIWPLAILLLVTGVANFWVIFLAIVASSALGGYQKIRRRRQPPPY